MGKEVMFGKGIVETELTDHEILDLANNLTNPQLVRFLEERIAESLGLLRGYVACGQTVQAQVEEGNIEAMEAVVDLIAQGFSNSLKTE